MSPEAQASVTVYLTQKRVDEMVVELLQSRGFADGDIDAAIMQGLIGPLSRVCGHTLWDENATARVCLGCKTVLPREAPP